MQRMALCCGSASTAHASQAPVSPPRRDAFNPSQSSRGSLDLCLDIASSPEPGARDVIVALHRSRARNQSFHTTETPAFPAKHAS